MRDAESRADGGDVRGFGGIFRAQPVVHRRRLDAALHGGVGEEEKRQAVRPARHGDAEALRAGQRGKIAAEAADKGVVDTSGRRHCGRA